MRRPLVLVALVLGTVISSAQEKLTLTTPVSQLSILDWQVIEIALNREDWRVTVILKSNVGERRACSWSTAPDGLRCTAGFVNLSAPSGRTLMIALNKANLSTVSLERRVYNQLVTDGAFVGSVTGTPQ
jgi:hypothetical protein